MLFGSRLNKLATSIRRALSEYAVLGINPPFVADFIEKKYLTGGASSTFSNAITHARAGNATMTDGYGPELVTNGDFSSSDLSAWSALSGGAFEISDSRLLVNFDGAGKGIQTTAVLESGKTYILTYNYERVSGIAQFYFDGAYVGTSIDSSNTKGSESIVLEGNDGVITFRESSGDDEFTGYLDNVSVREMPVIKWAPHNLVIKSENFSSGYTHPNVSLTSGVTDPTGGTSAFTVTSNSSSGYIRPSNTLTVKAGVSYTLKAFHKNLSGTASIGAYDASNTTFIGTQSITNTSSDWALTEFTFTTPAGCTAIYVYAVNGMSNGATVDAFGLHLYRSDLGGMVDNPERGDSYVPTTSAAKYLPRVGHHVFNGDAWVNEGVLAESESRTNLNIYSQTVSSWNLVGHTGRLAVTDNQAIGPDGTTSLSRIELNDSVSGGKVITQEISYTSNAELTVSCYFKPDEFTTFSIGLGDGENNWARVVFDTSTVSSTQQSVGASSGTVHSYGINDAGNGLYYAWATVSVTDDGDSLADIAFLLNNSATPTFNTFGANAYIGTGGDGAYAGLIQAEQASTPSSLIPTSGSSVTRASESFTIPSANLPWPTPQIIGSELADTSTVSVDSPSGTVVGGQSISLSGTSVYQVDVTISNFVSGDLRLEFKSGTLTSYFDTSQTFYLVPVGGGNVQFRTLGTTELDVAISVREINPLSVSIAMDGAVTYADEDLTNQVGYVSWANNSTRDIKIGTETNLGTGNIFVVSDARSDGAATVYIVRSDGSLLSPSANVPFSFATRIGTTFLNLAIDGVDLTENTTPIALPDLSANDLDLAHNYMGTIGTFRVWDKDLGDDGIVEATNPSLEPSLSLTFEGVGTNSFVVNDWSQ